MLPSIIHIRAVTVYGMCGCDAIHAIRVQAHALKILDAKPYSSEHLFAWHIANAVLEHLKWLAVEDMRITGKFN